MEKGRKPSETEKARKKEGNGERKKEMDEEELEQYCYVGGEQ